MPGFIAVLQITDSPGADTAVVLCNSTTGFSRSLGTDLLGIVADNEPYCPREWTPSRIDQDVLAMLGTWYWGPAPSTPRLTGDVLELRDSGGDGQAMRFRPDGDRGWTGMDGYQAGESLRAVPPARTPARGVLA
jgi:hypothetical protein